MSATLRTNIFGVFVQCSLAIMGHINRIHCIPDVLLKALAPRMPKSVHGQERYLRHELERIVECYSKYEEHGQTMVMIIMSHGMKFLFDDVIFASDFRYSRSSELFHRGVSLAWIVSRFSDQNCPSLKNKPKVFIVQACRKHDYNPGKLSENWNMILKENLLSGSGKESYLVPAHCAILKSCVEVWYSTEDFLFDHIASYSSKIDSSRVYQSSNELERIVECYSKYEEHGQTMVMIIMSHGMKFLSDDVIFASDFRYSRSSELFHRGVSLAWIVSRFSDQNCPSLKSKPKVFIVQACRLKNKPKVFIVQACRKHDYNPGKLSENWNMILKENLLSGSGKESYLVPAHCAILKSCVEGSDESLGIHHIFNFN
ncbi:unnamed protein product [Cyprideis torosa]|uniref:Uncharacterized protein n=1 Tax=Cyprideis torosa TaxID=163714 RepID=A0A7R8ZWT3_9CRUS|nr:unnamed protein product [Cyprideis torosa]CAG0905489.1 unnamed protein product [Cyprideis torosa]